MEKRKYKFENYRDREFPVYSSEQKGIEHLVHPHFHEDVEIIHVVDGEVLLSVGTTVHHLKKDDIVIIKPSVTHSAKSLSENAWIKGLVFNLKVLNQPVSFTKSTDCFLIDKSMPCYCQLLDEFRKATKLYHSQSPAYRMEMCSHLLMIFVALANMKLVIPDEGNSLHKRLTPVLKYISEHFSEPIKISELASLICVCDDHFIRLFKSATSKTPSEYIMDLRISKAISLLSTDTYSISETAEKTGFLNSAYFTKIFKKKLGITPTKYRKNFLS
ncbi:MAG: helix-turn-helix transcriptional regulator [Clostridia bacterium]|nr:helix-turn-helix transcriptional regulator [Clostridia bacterium]